MSEQFPFETIPANVRAYIYRVLAGLGVLAVAFGLVADGQVAAVVTFLGVVLGTGGNVLAAVKTPRRRRA